ncbi:MAG: VCBS repeat-containing protein [Bryobacterales bacterium]|nr:VCBS repeat-containing protein [Bryobacterales bacterium]
MVRLALLFLVFGSTVWAQRLDFKRWRERESDTPIRGAALFAPSQLFLWGDSLATVRLPRLRSGQTSTSGRFGAGGCLIDVNQDGIPDPVLYQLPERAGQLGTMVWLASPDYEANVIDTDAEFSDCLATTLFGEPGVLLLHRHAQVRFYKVPAAEPGKRWPYRELYSIYTASAQGGLLRADVDNDGREDILAGNYWLRSPADAEDSWRLFPINNWWNGPQTAMLRLGWAKPMALAAERQGDPARVSWFLPSKDAAAFWTEAPLEAVPPIRKPEALIVADLNRDGRKEVVIGENAGPGSRLLIYWALEDGRYQGSEIDKTEGLVSLFATDVNRDDNVDLVGVGPRSVIVWRSQRRK